MRSPGIKPNGLPSVRTCKVLSFLSVAFRMQNVIICRYVLKVLEESLDKRRQVLIMRPGITFVEIRSFV